MSDNDEGIIYIDKEAKVKNSSFRTIALEAKLKESLLVFNYCMPWCQRVLTSSMTSHLFTHEEAIDYLSILNGKDNYQIVAPHQFGLTSFAHYLVYQAYTIKNENWLYLNIQTGFTSSNINNKIRYSAQEMGLDISEVQCIILDNWDGRSKERMKMLEKIYSIIGGGRIILMCNMEDVDVLAPIETEESHSGFKLYYLRELSRQSIRTIVEDFNNKYQIAEQNTLLDRLLIDIDSLNEHRTPLNCIQLLMAYRNNFDAHPVNRSRVLEMVLDVIFKNSDTIYYCDALDAIVR